MTLVSSPFRVALLLFLTSCSAEDRSLGSNQPQSPPSSADDPRSAKYEQNAYQLSQGGRYFTWYGCGACHGDQALGVPNLKDSRWRYGGDFDQIYRSIAQGRANSMPAYASTIPIEQLWQITAYIRQLQNTKPAMIRRQNLDEQAEPQAGNWSGPLR